MWCLVNFIKNDRVMEKGGKKEGGRWEVGDGRWRSQIADGRWEDERSMVPEVDRLVYTLTALIRALRQNHASVGASQWQRGRNTTR